MAGQEPAFATAWSDWSIWTSQPPEHARWYATRRTRLTKEQVAKGLQPTVDGDTEDDLLTALQRQRQIETTHGWHEPVS
jgi:hypothetical protein